MTTRRQHYVWQHYLEGWQRTDGRVVCLRDGKVFNVNPRRILVERDYYKLSVLTRSDVRILDAFARRVHPRLYKVNTAFLRDMVHIANANAIIQQSNAPRDDKKYARSLVIDIQEKLHAGIERGALPIMRELRQRRTDFLSDDAKTITFYNFLAHQYFRTKTMHERIGAALKPELTDERIHRLRGLLCYCFATNLGCDLYVDRNNLDVVYLTNISDRDLITSDQPVINLLGEDDDKPPEDLILFYPILPSIGVAIAPKHFGVRSARVRRDVVTALNRFVAWQASKHLVSTSDEALNEFVDGLPKRRPPLEGVFGWAI